MTVLLFFLHGIPSPFLSPFLTLWLCSPPAAEIKRDTAYYPDTPLSSNHALMKGAALRPKDQITPDNMSLHVYGTSFGASDGTGQKFGTMAHMGMDKLVQEKDTTPPAMF